MTKLHREPLVHFIILGALLFAGHMLWQAHISKADYTITVTAAEMERQALIFAGENRRAPTDEDLKALLFAHVEEQALMREAQRIGLGEDDTIIRRRLAQKMRFIIEDVDTPALPGDADLKSWFKANLNNFISPETRSFSHIYLSPEAHGGSLDAEAQEILSKLDNAAQNWKALGDPFMMKRAFKSLNAVEAARLFGPNFSKELFELDGTHWQGPIESAFGLHIIQLDNVTPEVIPEFQDVRGDVENAWQKEAQRTLNQNNLKELIQKYKVKVEDPNEGSAG
jgi:parvulin-like peptidyl-prolyl isomerase